MTRNEVQLSIAEVVKGLNTIVVAVSGGVDSMALLYGVKAVKKSNQQVIVAHFVHHLRKEGINERNLVQQLCKEYGFTFEEEHWETVPNTQIETLARQARYQFFQKIYRNYNAEVLLTGHHLNDDVETFLMRLVRGSSLKGLQGIQPVSYRYEMRVARPFLLITKDELYRYAALNEVVFLEDASNEERTYYRNRVRLDWIPALLEENSQALEHIHRQQKMLTHLYNLTLEQFDDWFKTHVQQETSKWVIDLNDWNVWSQDKQVIYLQLLFEERLRGQIGTYHHRLLEQLQENLDRQHSFQLDINKQWQLQHAYGQLIIRKKTPSSVKTATYHLKLNQWVTLPSGEQIGLFNEVGRQHVDDKALIVPLHLTSNQVNNFEVRTRRPGDSIRLKMGSRTISKKIARLQMELKISPYKRDEAWLVAIKDSLEIIWYPNYRLNALYKVTKTDKMTHIFAYKK